MTFFSSPLDLHGNLFLRRVILPLHVDSGRFANSIHLRESLLNALSRFHLAFPGSARCWARSAPRRHFGVRSMWACSAVLFPKEDLCVTDPPLVMGLPLVWMQAEQRGKKSPIEEVFS